MVHMTDEQHRRDLLAVLLEHVGTSSASNARLYEVDNALHVLFRVARDKPEYLEPYFPTLCDMANHLSSMSLQQVGKSLRAV